MIVLSAIGLVVAFWGFAAGASYYAKRYQQAAIETGVAEWTIDAKTGNRSFRFIKPEASK